MTTEDWVRLETKASTLAMTTIMGGGGKLRGSRPTEDGDDADEVQGRWIDIEDNGSSGDEL
jgi:hypothetical protein